MSKNAIMCEKNYYFSAYLSHMHGLIFHKFYDLCITEYFINIFFTVMKSKVS
jgi:hypothetical protein